MKLNVNTKTETRTYNQPIYGVRGEFTLSNDVAVPYFSALMDIRRLASEVKTHEQVAPSLDQTYNLQELYQREIDPDRIERDLVKNYLMDPNKIKFFNSITIALLPKDESGRIISSFQNFSDNDPPVPCDSGGPFDASFKDIARVTFGGVQFISTDAAGISRLRWDSTRIDAVAVDGQHRLTALMRWFENHKNKALNEVEQRTVVPVIFLLLAEEVGFKRGAYQSGRGIKHISREIFTDLNKNAKTVDKATEIILDDRNLISRCVRQLVTEETCQEQEGRLPLSLVRWRDANVRFDRDYYLNSLVHLNLLVESTLDIEFPKHGMEKRDVLHFIDDLGAKLGDKEHAQLLSDDGISLKNYYTSKYLEDGEPVAPLTTVPSQFMEAAVDGFKQRYVPWMVRMMTELTGYKALLDYARANDLIKGLFSQFQSQPISHQQSLKQHLEDTHGVSWQENLFQKHKDAIEAIKGITRGSESEEWIFKAVFQKALIRLGKLVCVDTPADEREKMGGIDDLIGFLNELGERGMLKTLANIPGHAKLLWTFISLNPVSNTIQVTAASEKRIYALLTSLYIAWRYWKYMDKEGGDDWEKLTTEEKYNELTKKLAQSGTAAQWPIVQNGDNLAAETLNVFGKYAYIIVGKENTSDVSEPDKRAIARSRFSKIIEMALGPAPAKELADNSDTI
jgi:hypothetical protein